MKKRGTLRYLFERLWERYGSRVHWTEHKNPAGMAHDLAQFFYTRGYEKGKEDARYGHRRRFD